MTEKKHHKTQSYQSLNDTIIEEESKKVEKAEEDKSNHIKIDCSDQIKRILHSSRDTNPDDNLDYSIIKLSKNGIRPILKGKRYKEFIRKTPKVIDNTKENQENDVSDSDEESKESQSFNLKGSKKSESPLNPESTIKTKTTSNGYDLIILITAYNEGKKEFESTIQKGIDENIPDLYNAGCSNIAVIVIVDGLAPFHKASKFHTKPEEQKNFCPCNNNPASQFCVKENCKKKLDELGCQNETYFDQYVNWNTIKSKLRTIHNTEKHENQRPEGDKTARENLEIMKKLKVFADSKIEKAHLFCKIAEVTEKIPGTSEEKTFNYNFLFCIKQDNKRKLNTHTWFLKGFCPRMNPKFIIFLDVGTKPLKQSLSPLYNCLKNDNKVAGCCGEIIPDSKNWSNFVEQAQLVEYKFSHVFDKSLESLFGYISVLPGAFSAYRYECFNEDIMNVYFFTENNTKIGLFDANMYLAEDRILCLELVCMRGKDNLLRYIPESQAETDVPDQLWLLMMQRRRWNNGAWFSSIYTIRNWTKILNSNHSCYRKTALCLFMTYYVVSALFSWILVGAFYVSFSISLKRNLQETNNDLNKLNKFSTPIIMFYVSTLIAMVVISLSVKPEKVKHFLNILSFIYGLYTILTIIMTLRFIFRDGLQITDIQENISILMLVTIIILSFLVLSQKCFKPLCVILKGVFQFFFLSGTYVNMFLIYSICNIHDVSWGNRPGGESASELQAAHYESQRITWLIIWIISNGLFSYFFNWVSGGQDESARQFIIYFAWTTFGVIFVKILGGLLYIFYNCCCLDTRKRVEENHDNRV
jgi:cellulose synthase/poly-beta-1,6-N-acetylglucosamine synthase-like glycosyltransferase